MNVNYIASGPPLQLIEAVSAGNNELFFPNGHQSPSTQQDNKLSSEDEQLIVENVGSFGQRAQATEELYSSSSSTTTASPPSSTHRAGRYFHGRTRQKNVKTYLPDTIPGLSAYSSSAFPPVQDNSVGGGETDQSADVPATTASPLLINYGASQAVLSSRTAQELVATIEKSEQQASFAKPIVVQEVRNSEQRPFQYSTTFECEDDEQPITANPLLQASDSASSHILNPIQAGVALVNAGEAHLIGESEGPPPAPVNEHVEDDTPQVSQAQILNNSIVLPQQSAGNYVGVNPAFGGVHDEARASTTPQPQLQALNSQIQRQDQSVEVQKSIEIYSSSPAGSQELQLSEQQQPATIDQQLYLTNLAEIGAKQGSTRTRSETFTKLYEIADNYPKDSSADKPVYVVPPATYVLEDSSVLRNSLLQEKIHQHEVGHQGEIVKKQRQPYRPFEKKKIPISHPYPIPVLPVPIPIEKVIERKVPVPVHIPIPHPYPVEKPVHIPVPIEKIVEKPVHIPIPVEKIIEKKIPVAQPFPIEVTKYIEKPILVHAPYGVHYGVSYQQIMKPQNHGLYNNNLATFGLHNYVVNKNEAIGNSLNHSQVFQGYVYDKPAIPFHEGKENIEYKKLPYNSYIPTSYQSSSGSNSLFHRRHTQPQRDDYFGPVPPPLLQHLQRQFGFQSKQSYASYPERPTQLQTGSRKSRNHDPPQRFQKGNFRQSKIEYGFKPPMVPSVQYDEETASKVES